MTSHCPTACPWPNHWNPSGTFATNSPCRAHASDCRKITIVASVTTIDGNPNPATSQPLIAPMIAPTSSVAATTPGIGNPAFASSPAATAHIENCDPTEISICRATITSVIPIATTSVGAALTHVSRNST